MVVPAPKHARLEGVGSSEGDRLRHLGFFEGQWVTDEWLVPYGGQNMTTPLRSFIQSDVLLLRDVYECRACLSPVSQGVRTKHSCAAMEETHDFTSRRRGEHRSPGASSSATSPARPSPGRTAAAQSTSSRKRPLAVVVEDTEEKTTAYVLQAMHIPLLRTHTLSGCSQDCERRGARQS